jgi:hypothetical protein
VVEAVASRMKTIQAARHRSKGTSDLPALRFLAISATITNIEDVSKLSFISLYKTGSNFDFRKTVLRIQTFCHST